MDSDYNAIAKAYRKHIPVVLTLGQLVDWRPQTTYRGTHCPMVHPSTVQPSLVPGEPPFPSPKNWASQVNSLATGFYCADPKPFQAIYEKRQATSPSKKILYIGRYLDVKGVRELWSAFFGTI